VFAGDEPDDLADGAFGVEAGHTGEGAGVDLLVSCELGDIVERGAFGIGEERAVAVAIEGVEFIDDSAANTRPISTQKRQILRRATCSRMRKTASRGNCSFLSSWPIFP
jgi:hypothetical protein